MIFIEKSVYENANASHDFSILQSNVELAIRMFIEGMFFLVQHQFDIAAKWRAKLWTVFVEIILELDKPFNFSF